MPQLARTSENVKTIRTWLGSPEMQEELRTAAPSANHLNPKRIIRIAMTTLQNNPKLQDCDAKSFVGALITATQLGLMVDNTMGQAYLVPYKGKITFQAGYRGLMELARRSGEITAIEARVVFEKDVFDFEYGADPKLTHKPSKSEDCGAFLAAYAVARLKDGYTQFDVMWKREVDKIRAGSPAGQSGPWVTHYEEMAKKSVIKRLCKYLPSSPDLQRAIGLDDQAEIGLQQPLDVPAFIEEPDAEQPKGALDAIVSEAKKKRGRPKKAAAAETVDVHTEVSCQATSEPTTEANDQVQQLQELEELRAKVFKKLKSLKGTEERFEVLERVKLTMSSQVWGADLKTVKALDEVLHEFLPVGA